MSKSKIILLIAVVAAMAAFFAFDLGRFFDLAYLKEQQGAIEAYGRSNPILTAGFFFLIYVAVTALSLPGAAVMTLVGGAIFGLLWGTLIISFASSVGATLAFLASRLLFQASVQRRFGDKLRAMNEGVATKEGAFYLFALRLVPIFPFFAINLLMGLTPIRTWTFYWVSQVGMLAGDDGVRKRRHPARQIDGRQRDTVTGDARIFRLAGACSRSSPSGCWPGWRHARSMPDGNDAEVRKSLTTTCW